MSAVALIAFSSCEKKEAIAVTESQEVAQGTAEAVNYVVDTDNSNIEWRGYKIYENETQEQGHHGNMKLSSGTIGLENNRIVSGDFTINSATIESVDLNDSPEDKKKLDDHLRSGDFLDVENFPNATFHITSVNPVEGEYNSEISGNLKLRDLEKNVTFKANVGTEGDKLTIASEEFTINRQDFGIVFKGGGGSIIKDNVTLRVNVQATKGDAVVTTENDSVNLDPVIETPATEEVSK